MVDISQEKYKIVKQGNNRYVVMQIFQKNVTDKFPVAIFNSENMAQKYIDAKKQMKIDYKNLNN